MVFVCAPKVAPHVAKKIYRAIYSDATDYYTFPHQIYLLYLRWEIV